MIITLADNDYHVVASDVAAGILRQSLGIERHRLLIHNDCLSHGPLLSLDDYAQWRAARLGFLDQARLSDTHLAYSLWQRLKRGDFGDSRLVLWCGEYLCEQLLMAWSLAAVQIHGFDLGRVIHAGSGGTPDEPTYAGLNEKILKTNLSLQLVSPAQNSAYLQAWHAVTSGSPADLVAFCHSPDHPQGLTRAVCRMLTRFPDRRSGVSRWDWRLLRHCDKHGPRCSTIIAQTIGDHYLDLDETQERLLFWRLKKMADKSLHYPLIKLTGDEKTIRKTKAYLTHQGKAVLEGEFNHAAENPIDDWIGGFHMRTGKKSIWYYQNGELIAA